jgi:hypothetical protein
MLVAVKPPMNAKHTGTSINASSTDNLLVIISRRKTTIVEKPKTDSITLLVY